MNVSVFNSLPLKMQQIVVADLLSFFTDEKIFLYFIKINNILLYLLKYKQLETERCFEIFTTENKNDLFLLKLTKKYTAMIL